MNTEAGKNKKTGWVYAFFIYIVAILLYPVIFSKVASFCIKQDNLHQAYPFINKLASCLHKGYLPLWDANTFSGNTFTGGFETGIFYPPSIIFCYLFGSTKGIDVYYLDLLVAVHYLLALLGMYQLARMFRMPVIAAIVAALTYSFTGTLASKSAGQTCIFFGLTLLPWSIYFIVQYYWRARKWKYLVFAGLIAGLEILAGHIQPFFHTFLIIGLMIVFYEYQDWKNWGIFFRNLISKVSLLVLTAALIALPQLYYSSEYLIRCYRWVSGGVLIGPGQKVPLYLYSHWFILQFSNLANFLGQDIFPPDDDNLLYMGVLPLFLGITFLLVYRSLKIEKAHKRLTKMLLAILLLGIIAAFGYQTFFCYILYEIPFVNTVRQLGRYTILINFSASLLAGLGATYLLELKEYLFQQRSKEKFYILLVLLCNAIYWGLFQPNFIPRSISIPFLLTFLFILFLKWTKKIIYIPFLVIIFICVDLLFNRVRYLPATPPHASSTIYERDRIIDTLEKSYGKYRTAFDMKDHGLEKRNLGDMYAIQTTFGYSATYYDKYLSFINAGKENDSDINDLLNVRYILTDKLLDSNFVFKDSLHHINLYERKNYYPRCYWKRQLGQPGSKIEADNKEIIHQLVYSDLYEKLAVDCVLLDTLIFSEINYPGWSCYDNGKKTIIYSALIKNYTPLFRSIVLNRGHHIIEFKYKKVFYWF